MYTRIVLTIILGLCAGTAGGALGLGPSLILLPGLIMLNIVTDYTTAIGTTLLAMLPPISILAVMDYYKRGKIDILIAAILCITYIVSTKFGARINRNTSSKHLKYATFVIFLLISLFFFYEGYTD